MRKLLLTAFAQLPLPVVHGLGWLLGLLLYAVLRRQRHIALRNLELCLPELSERQRRQLARRSLIETGKTLLESFVLWLGPAWRVRRMIKASRGGESFNAACARGHGVILLAPHLGSWEMLGLHSSQRHPMVCLYRPQRSAFLDQLTLQGRSRFGTRLVSSNQNPVRELVRSLRQGDVLGILPDQNPGAGTGVFAPLFGVLANTPVLPGRLAHKHPEAQVFWAYAERRSWGRGFVLHFVPADPALADADALQAATALNRDLEQLIRRLPQQYWWSHNRFRQRPPGEADIYRR